MKKGLKTILLLALTVIMLFQAPITAGALTTSSTTFSDVSKDAWYYENVIKLSTLGIINGYPDGTFKPDGTITRGEFIKMLTMVAEIWSDKIPKGIHWAESDWNALNDNGLLEVSTGYNSSGTLFPCTVKELDTPITRYEMAFLINSVLYMAFYENPMVLKDTNDSFANHIGDYNGMDQSYRGTIEQCYAKGILMGDADSYFWGASNLKRSEAAAVIERIAWKSARKTIDWASEKEVEYDTSFTSFAIQYRTMSNADRRQALFGNPNKEYFTSTADAGSHIVGVKVNTWDIGSNGTKYTRTWTLYVNTVVAREVKAIFDYIYNSPEKFPIHALGGFRTTDTLRHSWGCAIDINPVENYYINYKTGQVVGSFCYKNGTSPYCIQPNGSVVKAFAMYGWGWGGQGWSTAADYMHFSILSSGG
ncbi:MAG: S-layer homology domain-containing protein [Oscillospiraceae bacterium]|nr:S-layer homology domain-containing protein [Oscillospiraceae bacterium]